MTISGDTVCSLIQTFPVLLILAQNNNRCLKTPLIYKPPAPTHSPEYYEAMDALFQSLFGHGCHGHDHSYHGYYSYETPNGSYKKLPVNPYNGHDPTHANPCHTYDYPSLSYGHPSPGYQNPGYVYQYPTYGYKKVNVNNISGQGYGHKTYAPNQVPNVHHKYKIVVHKNKRHGHRRSQKLEGFFPQQREERRFDPRVGQNIIPNVNRISQRLTGILHFGEQSRNHHFTPHYDKSKISSTPYNPYENHYQPYNTNQYGPYDPNAYYQQNSPQQNYYSQQGSFPVQNYPTQDQNYDTQNGNQMYWTYGGFPNQYPNINVNQPARENPRFPQNYNYPGQIYQEVTEKPKTPVIFPGGPNGAENQTSFAQENNLEGNFNFGNVNRDPNGQVNFGDLNNIGKDQVNFDPSKVSNEPTYSNGNNVNKEPDDQLIGNNSNEPKGELTNGEKTESSPFNKPVPADQNSGSAFVGFPSKPPELTSTTAVPNVNPVGPKDELTNGDKTEKSPFNKSVPADQNSGSAFVGFPTLPPELTSTTAVPNINPVGPKDELIFDGKTDNRPFNKPVFGDENSGSASVGFPTLPPGLISTTKLPDLASSEPQDQLTVGDKTDNGPFNKPAFGDDASVAFPTLPPDLTSTTRLPELTPTRPNDQPTFGGQTGDSPFNKPVFGYENNGEASIGFPTLPPGLTSTTKLPELVPSGQSTGSGPFNKPVFGETNGGFPTLSPELTSTTRLPELTPVPKMESRNNFNFGPAGLFSETCQTVDGETGSCLTIFNCQPYFKMLQSAKNNPSVTQILRKAHCGFEGSNTPKVCCPRPDIPNTPPTAPPTTTTTTTTTSTESPASGRSNDGDFISAFPDPPVCGTSGAAFSRVVGGVNASLGDFPWMALLGYQGRRTPGPRWLCGGSLISARHVLTAAHCLHNHENDLYLVRLGELDLERDDDGATPIDVPIKTQIKHQEYNSKSYINDIAILVLETEVQFTDLIRPICLPQATELRSNTFENYTPIIAGWGDTEFRGPKASRLQALQLPVVSKEFCAQAYSAYKAQVIDDRVLCAGFKEGGKDACQGDSGGPLMQPIWNDKSFKTYFFQTGVVSYGRKCAEAGFPGVYTRVTNFMPWIQEHVIGTN